MFYSTSILLLFVLLFLLLYNYYISFQSEEFTFDVNGLSLSAMKIINGGKCIHPKINVYDPEMMQFYHNPFRCKAPKMPMTKLENGTIVVLNATNYICWARCHDFRTYDKNKVGAWITTENATFNCEVVETKCSQRSAPVVGLATHLHIHTQIVEQKIKKPNIPILGKQYSVHIILIDSTSYTQSIRNFPNLRDLLFKKYEAVEFPYLNKYSDGSRENMIVLSFGKLQHSIERELIKLDPEPKWENNCKRNLDEEKRLIREFEDYGYVTNQNDDWWATLNYGCEGNIKRQSHHLYIPYVIAYENNEKLRNSLKDDYCLERHQHALEYEAQFLNSYKGIPKFSWNWLSHIGHNDVWTSKKAEPDLLKLFKENKEELDNSFIFFMGDHGLRHGGGVETRLGEYERKNPMLYVTVPSDLRRDYKLMQLLKQNSKELQTHFDIRATLLDILKYQPKTNYSSRETLAIPGELGNSFLRLQPLPRTCRTLPILPEYCICDEGLHSDITKIEATTAAKVGAKFVESINSRLADSKSTEKCRNWRLKKVKKLILRELKPTRQFEADITVENELSTRTAIFKVFVIEKLEDLVIKHYDRLDSFGLKGNCENNPVLKNICDCARDEVTVLQYQGGQ